MSVSTENSSLDPGDADGRAKQCLERARDVFEVWNQTELKERIDYLRCLRSYLTENLDTIVQQLAEETEGPRIDVLSGEVLTTLQLIRYYEENAGRFLDPEKRPVPFLFRGNSAYVEHRPYGVVAIISPWNLPLQLTLVPAITALVAGNVAVIKPSEKRPGAALLLEEIFSRMDTSVDPVIVVKGGPGTGESLIREGVDKVFFTGGVETGKKIRQQTAESLTPADLELGGKNPMLVFGDVSPERAARAATWAAFCNAGQMCISIERIYVQEDVYEPFLDCFLKEVSNLHVGDGDGAEIGPLVDSEVINVLHDHVEDAKEKGATLETNFQVEKNVVHPIVLTGVNHEMKIMREETFGPVVGLMTFQSEQEAVRLANDTRYGLNASVFCGDEERARNIAGQLDVGACYINNVITNVSNPHLPFGGNKMSGLGRYHGPEGLYSFTRTTSIMIDHRPQEQEVNWFPYTEPMYDNLRSLLLWRFGEEGFFKKCKRGLKLLKKAVFGTLK